MNLYTTFIENSLTINGIVQHDKNPNNGILLGKLDVNDNIFISFKIKIDENFPGDNLINWVNTEAEFIIDTMLPKVFRKFSNRNVINIRRIDLDLKNPLNQVIAREGDILTYKIIIRNTGDIPADQIILQYKFNPYTIFIENSLIVNDVVINPNESVQESKEDVENYFATNVIKSQPIIKKSFNVNQAESNINNTKYIKNTISYVEINLGPLAVGDTMNISFKVKVIKTLPISGIYDIIKIKGIFSLMPYIQQTIKIFENIVKINPYLEKDCIIVNKIFSYCQKRFCLKGIEVALQDNYEFENIRFKSVQLEQSTLKITPLIDRPSFSRVQFIAKIPYEITIKSISSKEEKLLNDILPDLYVDIIMFCSRHRDEFKYEIVLDSISKLVTKPIIEDKKLKFSVGIILVNRIVGKVQLSILSNGVHYNQCNCEQYKYPEKFTCNEFEKYKYKNFFDV